MTIEEFWNWVENVNRHQFHDHAEKINFMIISLTSMSPAEIINFNQILDELVARAHTPDLWNVVTAIYCGCSRNSFQAFSSWLVFQGKLNYEGVLDDPLSVTELIPSNEDVREESYQFFPQAAYHILADNEMPLGQLKKKEVDGKIAATYQEARDMYPTVADKYDNCQADPFLEE